MGVSQGLGDRTWLRRLGWATLLANMGIVLTGGAVRLTGSGLGCPTWPRCHGSSFTPHGALDAHSVIEFGNRTLTFVLTAIAIATFVSAWRSGRAELRRLALWLGLSVPAQAVLGGITVLTDLNPWVVAFHLLFSMAIISLAVLYLWRIDHPHSDPALPPRLGALAWATYAAGWLVLALGTVVTGSGPHAGDATAPRNGLDPLQLSQAHADAVFLFVGLSLGLLLALRGFGAPAVVVRAAAVLVAVELGQGLIGFVQYVTDLPIVLVEFHLLGATLVAATLTWVLLQVRAAVFPR
ncbi:heme A synthase [Marmoricola sp. URHB0036]|uniref:COX15/CtaA family protein n=1 Tax=Marmoricola sp. URHB0036 TaxID=1298863 RepID=UPI0004192F32|nr:COX15/CtaA family protein [Marmoricola sp. URHB0036]